MLVCLSPSKTLEFDCKIPEYASLSVPYFGAQAEQLVETLKNYSITELSKLMDISVKLAKLNYERFQNFASGTEKPAIFAYNGDVYDELYVEEYDQKTLEFANETLCIISGLYGILKPLDLIKPYRLEMSTGLKNFLGKNLYDFWRDKVTERLNAMPGEYLVNLASQEYSSVIIPSKLKKKKIDISFKEGDKVVSIYSKQARGMMANYIVKNNITSPQNLKLFNMNKYKFMQDLSSEEEYVFVR